MSNELIQKAAEALDIALGRDGVFNPPELDFMSAAYDGLVAALQPSPPQDVEEWMAKNKLWSITAREFSITTRSIRAFLAGKVLVPVEPTEQMVEAGCRQHICEQQDPWYSSTEISEFDCRAIYSAMLTASKGECEECKLPRGQKTGPYCVSCNRINGA